MFLNAEYFQTPSVSKTEGTDDYYIDNSGTTWNSNFSLTCNCHLPLRLSRVFSYCGSQAFVLAAVQTDLSLRYVQTR